MCLNHRKCCRKDKLTKTMSTMHTWHLSGQYTAIFKKKNARIFAESMWNLPIPNKPPLPHPPPFLRALGAY